MRKKRNILTANIDYYRSLTNTTKSELSDKLCITRPTFDKKCEKEGFTVAELRTIAKTLETKMTELLKGV